MNIWNEEPVQLGPPPEVYTIDMVRDALLDLMKLSDRYGENGNASIVRLLQPYNATRVSELRAGHYGAVIRRAREWISSLHDINEKSPTPAPRKKKAPMIPSEKYVAKEIGATITHYKNLGLGKNGQAKVSRILRAYGAESLSSLDPARYRGVIRGLRQARGQIGS